MESECSIDVPLLPAVSCNLLSVKKANEAGISVKFSHDLVTFEMSKPSRLLLSGTAQNSLYELNSHALTQATAATATSDDGIRQMIESQPEKAPSTPGGFKLQATGLLWHRRMGHIGTTTLAFFGQPDPTNMGSRTPNAC
jgi:hypothetical protein